MFKRITAFGLMAILVVFIGGCAFLTPNVETGDQQDQGGELQTQWAGKGDTLDDQFAKVAAGIPAFGGMFIDSNDVLNVYLLDISTLGPAAREIIQEIFSSERLPAGGFRILQGQYGFSQLRGWYNLMQGDVLGLPGTVFTDIDEAQNRLRIGVDSTEPQSQVEERLAQLGIPREAVIIEATQPIQLAATLQSKIRPLRGGLQIAFSAYVCTLGFNAKRGIDYGFVTNSHCTLNQGGVDNTRYFQPSTLSTTNRIGVETRDPSYFTGGVCPATKRCRYSDSAFAKRDSTVTADLGYIARPTALGSLTISATTPRFRIVGEIMTPLVGETLNKIGRTTGWTQGKISATCVNTGVSGTNIIQLCQSFVTAGVNSGDSGSPVFKITNSPMSGDVILYGILWGGNISGGGGTQFVFSPIGTSNIQRASELGALTTCASGFAC